MRGLLLLVLALCLGLATAAQAQRVAIRTGEHDGFTRLVLTLPEAGAWRVTRVVNGYAVAIGSGRPDFDLTDVYRLIPRTRLADIRTDPGDGRLRLEIGCRCHAWAIELRRGLLVIDLRDGPPPATSPYEVDDRGAVMAALQDPGAQPLPPQDRSTAARTGSAGSPIYDWREAALERASGRQAAAPPVDDVSETTTSREGNPAVPSQADDWRAALINALGRGATRGVVEMAPDPVMPPTRMPDANGPGPAFLPQVRIGDGPLPTGTPATPDAGVMTADGDLCIPDTALDLTAWGDPNPVAQVIGPLTRSIVEEFDRPDVAALKRAVHYLLYLGFGAEARQMLSMAGPNLAGAETFRAMSYVLDGAIPPAEAAAFEGMTGCDTAAALWSLLALPHDTAPSGLREDAVLRAFSALPLHLRRYLGPALAERLLSAGRIEAARAVRDAILRAPGEPGAAVSLMSLGIDKAAGTPPGAQELQSLRSTPGDTGLRATILSLETDIAAGRPPAPDLLTAAEALLREYRGTTEAMDLTRPLAEAQALAGDVSRALELAGMDGSAQAAVWAVLAAKGQDGDILTYGLRNTRDLPLATPPETDRAMARRLLALGFPREAMAWIDPARRSTGLSDTEDRILMAEALLADRDARKALMTLGAIQTPEAETLRTMAMLALNAGAEAGGGLRPEDQAISARRTARWDVVAEIGDGIWREAAALVPGPPPGTAGGGALAQGQALREESAEARAKIAGLLEASRLPDAP